MGCDVKPLAGQCNIVAKNIMYALKDDEGYVK